MYHLGLFVFFPRVLLSSRVTGACPVTTDLIMRVNVRTTMYLYCVGLLARALYHLLGSMVARYHLFDITEKVEG